MRRVSIKKIKEVLKLKYQMDFSFRRISKSVGISASTALEYCRRFEIISASLEEFFLLDEDEMYKQLFPEKKAIERKSTRPKPDVEYIDKEIRKKGVTFLLLWQEYKEENPDDYGYTHFKTYYHKYKKKLNPSLRQIHLNGEKLFVDYSGLTVSIYDSNTGEINKAQIFVAVLGASGYTYVDTTPSQKEEYFIKSHVKAFEFFNGVPKILVPDNLKSTVIKNNKKDGIVLNENYKSMADYYSCVIEPARPFKLQDKSLAEQGVLAIQRWILAIIRNRKFFSVDELNIAIAPLLDIYNNKRIKKLNKSRTELFEQNDQAYLKKLPVNRYIYKEIKIARVDIDYHVNLHKHRYSVPFKYIKEQVEVKYSSSIVQIYHQSKLISTHPRIYTNGYSTKKEHMPLNHKYQEEKFNPSGVVKMEFMDQLNAEISRMTIENFIALSLMFLVPFYFSRKARTLFFHLLYSSLGLYMIFFTQDVRILNDPKLLAGLGLILPQVSFIFKFVNDVIYTIKMMTANTYYFFVTIYYKILRFISWIQDIILVFKNFSNRKKDSDYEEEDYQEEQNYNNSYEDSSYSKKESYNDFYKQNYQEENQSYNYQENINYEEPKKAYRKLVRIYHPDLNPNNIKQMTEITQLINMAYQKLEKIHA